MRTIPFGKPIVGDEEKAAVLSVLDSGIYAHGKKITQFEADFANFAGSPHAIGVASCTAGLHLFYFHLGLMPGDEVIVPALTHTATAHAVELTGARAVFVDVDADTGNMNIQQVEAAVSSRTRAICPVHFLGLPVDMDKINAIAKEYDLAVVEDCALAVGSYYKGKHMGLWGDGGCFSFYPVKHMTTAEGGMVICNDETLAGKIRAKRAFGMDKHVGQRKLPGIYDIQELGFNYRMNEIQAAIGIEQVKRLPGFLAKRKENYQRLSDGLRTIDQITLFKSSHGDFESSYYCHSIVLADTLAASRFEIMGKLKAAGIGTSIYYPGPVPLMTYYKDKYGYEAADFPIAARISNQSIALPVGPHLGLEDMDYIVDILKEAISDVTKQ